MLGDLDERGDQPGVFTGVEDKFDQAVVQYNAFPAPTGECPAHLPPTKPSVG